jgi:hypothetical protein
MTMTAASTNTMMSWLLLGRRMRARHIFQCTGNTMTTVTTIAINKKSAITTIRRSHHFIVIAF